MPNLFEKYQKHNRRGNDLSSSSNCTVDAGLNLDQFKVKNK